MGIISSRLLGIPTICILDNEGVSCDYQREKLKAFPAIQFHDYRRREPLSDELLRNVAQMRCEPTIEAFDFEMVYSLIES